MTLLVVFRATDGLLVLADGRRTQTTEALETIVLNDAARKGLVVPSGNAVVLAAGWTQFGARFAADVFEEALELVASDRQKLTLDMIAAACFEALSDATNLHRSEGRAAWLVVAGFDDDRSGARVLEGVVGAEGAVPPTDVDMDSCEIYTIPAFFDESVGHEVRARFGYFTPEEFDRRLHLPIGHPEHEALHAEGYSLAGLSLDAVRAKVIDEMPRIVDDFRERFVDAGVGGTWTMYRVQARRSIVAEAFRWGPLGSER